MGRVADVVIVGVFLVQSVSCITCYSCAQYTAAAPATGNQDSFTGADLRSYIADSNKFNAVSRALNASCVPGATRTCPGSANSCIVSSSRMTLRGSNIGNVQLYECGSNWLDVKFCERIADGLQAAGIELGCNHTSCKDGNQCNKPKNLNESEESDSEEQNKEKTDEEKQEEVTPVQEEVTPVQEEVTTVQEEVTPVQEEAIPVESETGDTDNEISNEKEGEVSKEGVEYEAGNIANPEYKAGKIANPEIEKPADAEGSILDAIEGEVKRPPATDLDSEEGADTDLEEGALASNPDNSSVSTFKAWLVYVLSLGCLLVLQSQ